MRLGVDLGGTKIEVVALDEDGSERLRRRVDTPVGDYPSTLECIAALVAQAERSLGCAGVTVGIGIPGSLSPTSGLVRNANSTWLNGRALKTDLQVRLEREVRIANDANCFALSEAVDGAGRGARVVFGVILGTGVGGGIVIEGSVLQGRNAIAGEWGHNPLAGEPEDAPVPLAAAPSDTGPGLDGAIRCWCGRSGCIETYLCGPALARDHLRHTGQALSAPRIAAGARGGDPACSATLDRYERRLARALAGVVNVLDPDLIVLGGGLSNIESLYPNLARLLPAHVFSDRILTRIVRARHGDSSGVRGAAWLWPPGEVSVRDS